MLLYKQNDPLTTVLKSLYTFDSVRYVVKVKEVRLAIGKKVSLLKMN